jgi:hypothetical protein
MEHDSALDLREPIAVGSLGVRRIVGRPCRRNHHPTALRCGPKDLRLLIRPLSQQHAPWSECCAQALVMGHSPLLPLRLVLRSLRENKVGDLQIRLRVEQWHCAMSHVFSAVTQMLLLN